MKTLTLTLITICALIAWTNVLAIERVHTGPGSEGVAINSRTQIAVVTSKSYAELGKQPVDTGTLSIIDLKTKQVIDTIEVGGVPVGPAINEETNTVVFSDKANNAVVILDLASGVETARIPVGENPSCVDVDAEHNLAVVASVDDSKVYVIDLAAANIKHTIEVGAQPVCMHWSINPNNMTAIVANMGADTLTVVDIQNGSVLKTIPVSGPSSGASLNPQTNTAVVPLLDNTTVIVDLNSGTVTHTVSVGDYPVCSVIDERTNVAFISNYVGGSVSAIDLNTGMLISTFEGVGEGPTCMAVDATQNLLLVTNHGGDTALIKLDDITVADVIAEEASGKIVGTIPIGAGPFGVTVNPYTRVAINANYGDGTASVIDLTTLKVTDTIEIGGAPSGPDVNPYTNIAVFANEVVEDAGLGENHVVSIVDLTTGEVKTHIPVGEESFPICVNIDAVRNIVVVPLRGRNQVLVIDLETEEVIHTIPVGMTPMCMHWCINPYTNQAIVANMDENTLSVLDLEQGVEIQRIPVGAVPVGASLNPYTNIAVVPNLGSNDVSVVDLTKGEVIGTIPVGAEPNCSVIESSLNFALISNALDDTVSVIDLNTMSVVDTITVGVYPTCLAIDETTMTALVTNTNSNDLTIIDLTKIATATEDYSRTFFLQLESGLNMISLPLKSITQRTARDLMNEIGATVAIKLDTKRSRFVGFTETDAGDGFTIEGGQGYIVNVKESKVVPFVGAAWTNEPPVEAAPPLATDSTWAFVVSGALNSPNDKPNFDGYAIQTKNLRTGDITMDIVSKSGYFALASADLSQKSIIQAGDKVEIIARDASGDVVAKVVRTIDADNIGKAYLNVNLKLGEMIPSQTVLLQNYPNPFNPETWIPYQLQESAKVMIRVYNTTGGLVRTLNLGQKASGYYLGRTQAAYWDGKNNAGEKVASGIYFYQINAGDFSATRRMLVVK
ncbi:PQQ-binding-like beta-propeller repeat protein [bacterium]|nr:PQQ-binding-like beta-propeller repeat protein [bacterium]